MDQYTDLNVKGKITQAAAQGTNSDDVVKYGTLDTRVPSAIPEATSAGAGLYLAVENTGTVQSPVYEYVLTSGGGGGGDIADVRVEGTSVVSNHIADVTLASLGFTVTERRTYG